MTRTRRDPNVASASALAAGLRILSFCASHPGMVGRLRLARILTGGISEEDLDRGVQFSPDDAVSDMQPETMLALIDGMIADGQLVKTYGDRPRLALTRRGFAVLTTIEPRQP